MLSGNGIGRAAAALLRAIALALTLTILPAAGAAATPAAAPSAAVSSPAASGPTAPAPTALTISVTPTAVTYPDPATASGTISVPGAPLRLLSSSAGTGTWTEAGATTAAADGSFSFTVDATANTDLRVEYAGDGDHAPATADATVVVLPRVTSSFPKSLWLGGSVTLSGAVTPAHPGAPVLIERRVDGVWQPFLTTTLDDASTFALAWTPSEFGFFRLRARVDADAGHGGNYARSELVIVNRPNAHRVPYKFEHYIVMVRHEYRLYYYEHGALVRRFNIALGRPGYATPLGYFRIRAKVRPGGGALGSCVMYYLRSIAIHGTNQPSLLRRFPRNFSHGCARMYNNQALWLYHRCPRGTPVHNLR